MSSQSPSTRLLSGTLLAAAAGGLAYLFLRRRRRSDTASNERKTERNQPAAAGVGVVEADKEVAERTYEQQQLVNEYLMMHYGRPEELLPPLLLKAMQSQANGALNVAEFPVECAKQCFLARGGGGDGSNSKQPTRCLDVGCAVGRSSFELLRYFDQVVGLDFSNAFINTANRLKIDSIEYKIKDEGDIVSTHTAEVNASLRSALAQDPTRLQFVVGDACNLPESLGQFDVVLAANLLCRLPEPRKFLSRLSSLIVPGGHAVLISPYTWLEQYTRKSEWVGGYYDEKGVAVTTAQALPGLLPDFELVAERELPFFIRETRRKNQWTVSHVTVWRRK